MSMIYEKIVYRFQGQEFRDLPAVKYHVENKIGEILDANLPVNTPPEVKLALVNNIFKDEENRERLVNLLTTECNGNPDPNDEQTRLLHRQGWITADARDEMLEEKASGPVNILDL